MLKRRQAAALVAETLAILRDGHYDAPGGGRVDLTWSLEDAVALTVDCPPRAPLPAPPPRPAGPRPAGPRVEVTNETTLAAARRLADEGLAPAALNFASARRPGGGFREGSLAQEESLARASGLYACLEGSAMYEQRCVDSLYTDWVVYSPSVPVFRDEAGNLLDAPRSCAFLTCAAVNVRALDGGAAGRAGEVEGAMRRRATRVLAVAAARGHGALVLGAWGCGVFGNEPAMVARVFGEALDVDYRDAFDRVTFAIVDASPEGATIGPFRERFGGGAGA
jgi:uncharacterized protein (TIGR02452 family)